MFQIPSSSSVYFCLNNSLRGVDRSDSSLWDDGDGTEESREVEVLWDDGDGNIVSAEESREVEVLWCVRRLSVLSEPHTPDICIIPK